MPEDMSDRERDEMLLKARAFALNRRYTDSVDCYAKLIAEPGAMMDRELFREALAVQHRGEDRELNVHIARIHCAVSNIIGRREWERLLADSRYAISTKRLEHYGRKVYSQNEEDGLLAEVFHRIGTTNKRFVEFGVEAGLECNTHYLLHLGWSGAWIEGNDRMYNQSGENFRHAILSGQLTLVKGWATAETMNDQLRSLDTPSEIDLLSIDVDGMEYWLWKATTITSPRVVIIEYNAQFVPPILHVVPYNADWLWKGSDYGGASLQSLTDMARTKGYQLVGCNITGGNAIFVRDDLTTNAYGSLFAELDAAQLYQPARWDLYRVGAFNNGHPPEAGPWLDI